jgi:hypothetical protein
MTSSLRVVEIGPQLRPLFGIWLFDFDLRSLQ